MNQNDLKRRDINLAYALEFNDVVLPSNVLEIVATIVGERDGANWHWLVVLEDGQCAYITGGCDYTGWDCRSSCEEFVEPTMRDAVRQIPEAYRDELVAQLPEQTRHTL